MPIRKSPVELPAIAGIGLRSAQLPDVVSRRPDIGWLEINACDLRNDSAAAKTLESIRPDYPVALHDLGFSLSTRGRASPAHLAHLAAICARFEPAMVSEVLSGGPGDRFQWPDDITAGRDDDALKAVCENIHRAQDALRRRIVLAIPTTTFGVSRSTMFGLAFLGSIVKATGCGLLLDICNSGDDVGASNIDALGFIAGLPADAIKALRLSVQPSDEVPRSSVPVVGQATLVPEPVRALYAAIIALIGRRPTLIKPDAGQQSLFALLNEAKWADTLAEWVHLHQRIMALTKAGSPLAAAPQACRHPKSSSVCMQQARHQVDDAHGHISGGERSW